MIVALVAAVADNGVIGRDGQLPWHLPKDLQWFQQLTTGHTIIMGRKTFQSIGKPLPDRRNIVLSRDESFRPKGTTVVVQLEEALKLVRDEPEVFVVGGAAVYAAALPRADRLYLTRVHTEAVGDVAFPAWDRDDWQLVSQETHEMDDRHASRFTFQRFDRIRSPAG